MLVDWLSTNYLLFRFLACDLVDVFHRFGNLISLIKKLLSQDWIVDLCHTLWKSNSAADCLVKLSAKSFEKLVFLGTSRLIHHVA